MPAPEREVEHIRQVEFHGRWSYPSMLVMKDRVLVAHTYSHYEEHPTEARLVSSKDTRGFNQKLKVLPLNWFYGGKEPADNPFLPRAHDPASPLSADAATEQADSPVRRDAQPACHSERAQRVKNLVS